MEDRPVRWMLIGFGVALAAGVAGMVIAALRRRPSAVGQDVGAEAPAPELQPVS
jgi:hypothetical protein